METVVIYVNENSPDFAEMIRLVRICPTDIRRQVLQNPDGYKSNERVKPAASVLLARGCMSAATERQIRADYAADGVPVQMFGETATVPATVSTVKNKGGRPRKVS